MVYSKPFLDLQVQVAEKVANLSGLPLAHTLMEYTNLYIRFGLGRDFDPAHPVWQMYLESLKDTDNVSGQSYQFYISRSELESTPHADAAYGCFSYARLDDEHIRLHFHNAETEDYAPLSIKRMDHRLADLTALFAHAKTHLPPHCSVVGVSWLYNLEAYRRLFPPLYLATARVRERVFRHMPLWGQFLNRHGALKADMTQPFLVCLERLSDTADLYDCFPFKVIHVEATLQIFYDFYGI